MGLTIKHEKRKKFVLGVSSGVVIGALIGIATGDLGLWISLWLANGAGMGFY